MNTIAVITGDIIDSRQISTDQWMEKLKEVLAKVSVKKNDWEIYRGDSFQLSLPVKTAMTAVFMIKSAIKSVEGIDVRMAVGIGTIDYKSRKIKESNGSAFVNSGRKFESLKKQTLGIQTEDSRFDAYFNVLLDFATFVSSSWKPSTAEVVYAALCKPDFNQKELANLLHKKSQGTISSALKRAGYEELQRLIRLYESEFQKV